MAREDDLEMHGEGVAEIWAKIKELAGKAVNVGKKAKDFYTSETGTALRNMLPSGDANAANQFPGELHAILQLPGGGYGTANFAGPGTQVLKRIRRGDRPRTYVDGVSKIHDIQYELSGGDPALVRAADERMKRRLREGASKDSSFNINAGLKLMEAKNLAEDLNILKKGSFAGKSVLNADDKKLLEDELKKTEAQGYGKIRKGGAKYNLMMNEAIQKELKKKKKNSGLAGGPSVDPATGEVTMGYGARVSGSGARVSGSGARVSGSGARVSGSGVMPKFDFKAFVPLILAEAEKKAPDAVQKIKDMLNDSKVKDAIAQAAASVQTGGAADILPAAAKNVLSEKLFMGSGEMEDKFKEFLNKWKLVRGSGKYSKETHKKLKKLIRGSGFWSDLWSGFKYGWSKGKQILGTIAPFIPGIGPEIKKVVDAIPTIPGTAGSYDELKQQLKENQKGKGSDSKILKKPPRKLNFDM